MTTNASSPIAPTLMKNSDRRLTRQAMRKITAKGTRIHSRVGMVRNAISFFKNSNYLSFQVLFYKEIRRCPS